MTHVPNPPTNLLSFTLPPFASLKPLARTGYVPNSSKARTLTFLSMLVFTTAYLLAKTLGMALLARASKAYLGLYLLFDLGLFFIFKIAKNDFWYWVPIQNPIGAFGTAIIIRVIIKILADFTGTLRAAVDDLYLVVFSHQFFVLFPPQSPPRSRPLSSSLRPWWFVLLV